MKTPEYLLTKLIEECAEITQRATKALTFGLTEKQPGQHQDNVSRLRGEINDFLGILQMLEDHRVLPVQLDIAQQIAAKKDKVIRYAEYSVRQGTLTDTAIFPPGHPMHDRGEGKTTRILKAAVEAACIRGQHAWVVVREIAQIDYCQHIVNNLCGSSILRTTSTRITFNGGGSVEFIGPSNQQLRRAGPSQCRMVGRPDDPVFLDHTVNSHDCGPHATTTTQKAPSK